MDTETDTDDVIASANALIDFLESQSKLGADEDENQNSTVYAAWSPCLLIPEIARKVFAYLKPSDLANVRLVCKSWNFVSNCVAGEAMKADFATTEALRTFNASGGAFAGSISKFQMSMKDGGKFNDDKDIPGPIIPHYNEFFEKFGSQIKSLSFSKNTSALMKLVFTSGIHQHLTKLETLKIRSSLKPDDVVAANFDHLRSLRHFTMDTPRGAYGGPEMLTKLLDHCQLKSLKVYAHFGIREELNEVLKKAITHPHLEKLSLQVLCARCRNTFDRIAENVKPPPLKHLSITRMGPRATLPIFHQFFVNFQDSLQSLKLTGFFPKYLEALPNFASLKSLILRFCEDDEDGFDLYDPIDVLDLKFCSKFERLEKLGLGNFKAFDGTSLATCRIKNLRTLTLELEYIDMTNINPIKEGLEAKCFPNLTKMVLVISKSWESEESEWKLGNTLRIEFSLRSPGFRHFMTNLPHTKLIQGQTDSILCTNQIELILNIHGYVTEHCDRFRETQLQPAQASLQMICLLSSVTGIYWSEKRRYFTMTHSQLRSAGDTNLKRNQLHSYQIQELDVLGLTPTFLLERLGEEEDAHDE